MSRLLIPSALAVPALSAATHLMPWWAAIPASLGPAAYICRYCLQYKLAAKALEKARPRDIAAVMTAISTPDTGRRPKRRPGQGPRPSR